MKKRKAHSSKASGESKKNNSGQEAEKSQQQQASKKDSKKAPVSDNKGCDSDDENEGFGNWLRSSDGVAYMRLFVVANSLLVVMTMSWSHVWQMVEIIREMLGV